LLYPNDIAVIAVVLGPFASIFKLVLTRSKEEGGDEHNRQHYPLQLT
jgi:hypothetical protein